MSKFGYVAAGLVGAGLAVGGAYLVDRYGKKNVDECECLCDGCDDCEADAEDTADAE